MVEQNRRADIKVVAENIHQKVMRNNIDNENLATYLMSCNIGVYSGDFSSSEISAYITFNHDRDRPEIYVDGSQNDRRQIFSIAHELGHLVLHWRFVPNSDNGSTLFNKPDSIPGKKESILAVNYRRSDGYKAEDLEAEYEANYFAGDFLVPENNAIDFLEGYQGLGFSDAELIKRMKENYFINDQTARIKLDELRDVVDI